MFAPETPRDYPYRKYETMKRALERGRLTEDDRKRVVALYDGEIAKSGTLRLHPDRIADNFQYTRVTG